MPGIPHLHKLTLSKGGRQFSKNLRPLDADGGERSMWADPPSEEEEEDSEDEDSEEDSEDEKPSKPQQQEMTREERRAAQKAKKEAAIKKKQGVAQPGDLPPSSDEDEDEDDDEDMPANPNHSTAARKQAAKAVEDPSSVREAGKVKKTDDVSQLSRREREAVQQQQAKEKYQKLHAEGKTEEARADLERLKIVKQQREEAAARKEAEKQEKELLEKEKKEQMERMERQAKLKAQRGGRGGKKGGKS